MSRNQLRANQKRWPHKPLFRQRKTSTAKRLALFLLVLLGAMALAWQLDSLSLDTPLFAL